MVFWAFNVGDKLIFNPKKPKKDMEREYYIIDRYIEGIEEGIALNYPNVRIMYVLLGVASHALQAVDEYSLVGKLIENDGEVRSYQEDREYAGGSKTMNFENKSDSNAVNHPSYYNVGRIEVIDFIQDKKLNFALGNVVKYVCRAGLKDNESKLKDLKKARNYIDFEIKEAEGAENN